MTDSVLPGSPAVPLVRLVNEKVHLKNWYIEIQASCPELIDRFKRRCYLMPKTVHWFHQGNSENWQMFEF